MDCSPLQFSAIADDDFSRMSAQRLGALALAMKRWSRILDPAAI